MLSNCIMTFHLWIKKVVSQYTEGNGIYWCIKKDAQNSFSQVFCLGGLLPPGMPYHIALLFALFNIYVCLFIWLHWVLVAACELFSCSMWDLALWPRMEPRPSAWQVQGFSHWTTRGVPFLYFLSFLKLSHVYTYIIYIKNGIIYVNIMYGTDAYYLNVHILIFLYIYIYLKFNAAFSF